MKLLAVSVALMSLLLFASAGLSDIETTIKTGVRRIERAWSSETERAIETSTIALERRFGKQLPRDSKCRTWYPPMSQTECNFTRTDAYVCILDHINTNGDSVITTDELHAAIDKYVPWWAHWLAATWGPQKIMQACDADHNGVITAHDWEESTHMCLPEGDHGLCMYKWFCECAGSVYDAKK